jgi:ankyrin repeat protein
VEELIAYGAELRSRDGGFTALGCYASGADRAAKVHALIAHGGDPNAALNGSSEPLLIVYAQAGYTDVVRRLLDAGADIEARGTNGNDAWTEASVNHRKEMADLLLARRGSEDRKARK